MPSWALGTNLVKDYQAMIYTIFQAPEPSSSGEENFKCISFLNQRPLWQGHFGHHEPSGSEEEDF